ncbi:MAG TPA: mitochondrial fission ELM1 family protein [Stellaceae bacterium]|nr:mitochondrial fission ELM1 family protein [Stellaceae bacterium]
MKNAPPHLWVLHDGKIGMANQVMGLAEAVGFPFVEKRLVPRAPWRALAPPLWLSPLAALGPEGDMLNPPWPDLLIACGRLTVAPARAVKRASGGRVFWVQVQDPRFARSDVDLMVVPGHDPARGANVISTLGAVHRVDPHKLAEGARRFAPLFAQLPRPLVGVLLGGNNRVFTLTPHRLATLVDQLAALAGRGHGLMISPSRRTDEAGLRLLGERLAGLPAFIWDGVGDNPYFGMLALADALVVTGDSVSMVSEAAATGKPVHVVDLEGGSDKFARFHRAMREAGITRTFQGVIEHWHYTPPDDTARAAAEIHRRLAARKP